jgi:ElaB/YqjD/DUF883 family membrane-anchored ribosome-binding protein
MSKKEIDRLRDEVARLRAALEKILRIHPDKYGDEAWSEFEDAQKIAKEALEK